MPEALSLVHSADVQKILLFFRQIHPHSFAWKSGQKSSNHLSAYQCCVEGETGCLCCSKKCKDIKLLIHNDKAGIRSMNLQFQPFQKSAQGVGGQQLSSAGWTERWKRMWQPFPAKRGKVRVRDMHYSAAGLFPCHRQTQAPSYCKVTKWRALGQGRKELAKTRRAKSAELGKEVGWKWMSKKSNKRFLRTRMKKDGSFTCVQLKAFDGG